MAFALKEAFRALAIAVATLVIDVLSKKPEQPPPSA